ATRLATSSSRFSSQSAIGVSEVRHLRGTERREEPAFRLDPLGSCGLIRRNSAREVYLFGCIDADVPSDVQVEVVRLDLVERHEPDLDATFAVGVVTRPVGLKDGLRVGLSHLILVACLDKPLRTVDEEHMVPAPGWLGGSEDQ